MKKHLSTLTLILCATTPIIVAKKKTTPTLRIATYNITHGNKNNWLTRQTGVRNTINNVHADIFGLQEVITANNQFNTVEKIFPGYAFIGEPRKAGIQGWNPKALIHRAVMLGAQDEYCPIFYNKNIVEMLNNDTFGINAGGVIGKNWFSGWMPRICTVGKFKDKKTGTLFFVYNTHLDHKSEERRTMQMNIILDDVAHRCKRPIPVFIMGDFNTSFIGDMEKVLTSAGFKYTKNMTTKVEGPAMTHEKGKGNNKYLINCDLITVRGNVGIHLFKVLNTMSETTSDHNPVCVDVSL